MHTLLTRTRVAGPVVLAMLILVSPALGPAAADSPKRAAQGSPRAVSREDSTAGQASSGTLPARPADAFTPLDLCQVRVGGEIGRRIEVTIHNNLLVLDADGDFLEPFRRRSRKGGYIGLGKLIDAAVRLAAYSREPEVVAQKNHLVDTIIRLQEPDGYLGMLAPESRMKALWDIHEMSYIIYGLLTDYQYFDRTQSLVAARKGADYILQHWSEVPDDWGRRTGVATWVAVTSLERTMLALARLSGDPRYREFCLNKRALADWDPEIIIGRRPLIEGHIYAYLCRGLAQLELYRTRPDEKLLGATDRAIRFMARGNGLAITGGCGQWETWTDDQDGRGQLGETCATAYQVRVYDNLLRLRGQAIYGDLMERTIYNALFAAQSPDGRRIRYYCPLEGRREYHPTDTYCCPCNYRRIVAELPAMVYYRAGSGVVVNLYTASEAEMKLAGGGALKLRQETDYPSSGRVVIRVECEAPARFALLLRIPAWCNGAVARVNEQPVEQPAVPGRFLTIEREWHSGDRLGLEMPMPWRLVRGRRRQAGRAAVMRGPVVFCLNPAQHEQLADWDGADLGRIVLDPESLGDPVADDSVRPGGVACRVEAWHPGYRVARPGDLKLLLTEFADPGGRAAYFRLQDMSAAGSDELLAGKR